MTERPLLFMDVDGVLALWDPIVDVERVRPAGDAGVPVLVPFGAAGRLQRLAERFDVVWATAWGTDAPHFLAPLLGIGASWPVLGFDFYKWAAICDHSAGRPFAWVDDEAGGDADSVREHSRAPHLVVAADHRVGLSDHLLEELLAFADHL